MRPRKAHAIKARDRGRAECSHPACANRMPAVMTEHVPHAGGVSFFHYCADCWLLPAADGGPTAEERTGVALPDALDYERRWLAECRAHGETRRKLEALEAPRCTCETCKRHDGNLAPEREDDGEADDAWTGGFSENH